MLEDTFESMEDDEDMEEAAEITVPLLQGSLPNKDVFLHLYSMMCDSCQPPGTQAGAAGSSALLNESLHKARPMSDEQLRLGHQVFDGFKRLRMGGFPEDFAR